MPLSCGRHVTARLSHAATAGFRIGVGVRWSMRTVASKTARTSAGECDRPQRLRQELQRWWAVQPRSVVMHIPRAGAPNDDRTRNVHLALDDSATRGREEPRVRLRDKIVNVFLPKGYPRSVTDNYMHFTRWNLVSSVCGTVVGVLSTQSLLRALGMGVEGAIPVAATLNWVIKDGLGLLGGVIYTSLFSGRFDSEPRRYRFKAAAALQLASLCELLTPLAPGYFLFMASLSNIAKNMAWLTLGGTRATMNLSLCLRDNLGDVTAKAGSQNTAASLVGTGIGVVLAAMVGDNLSDSLLFFVPVSATSLYAVYRSNCAVLTRSLSAQRLELILDDFLSAVEARKSRGEVAEGGNTALLYAADTPSPHAVAQKEAFIRRQNSPFIVPLSINTDLTKVMHKLPADDDSRRLILREAFQQTNFIRPELYFLHIEDSEAGPVAHLWIEKRARSADVLRGLLHAAMVRRTCGLAARESKVADVPEHHRARLASTILFAHHVVDELYPALDGGLRAAGWNVDDLLVEERGGRLEREFIGKTLY